MKVTIALFSLSLLSSSLYAEEKVRAMTFFEEPLTITAVPGKQRHLLVVLPEPGISSPVYALKGMLRYENVQGDGFLRMDNHFGETGSFFTKSLESTGPLGKITGSSDWRPFVLPFYAGGGDLADGATPIPGEITLSLYLPGSGTVSIRDVELYQYASGENPLGAAGQWFDERSAGLLGAIGGALMGLWGALIGVLSSRGKARHFVLGSANAILIIGVAGIVGGVVAFASDQPYAVYYSLLLMGLIVVVVTGILRRTLATRYEQFELKRMQSMDV